jgi:hypothetical protein
VKAGAFKKQFKQQHKVMSTKALAKQNIVPPAPSPTTLLEMAIEKGADLEQLKQLMDLQERWEKKEAKKAFLDALSRFQTMVPAIRKSRTAKINSQKGSYSYKFADLGTIANSIKHSLNECGLSYRWEFEDAGVKLKVTCYVSHRDGHTETSIMEAGMDNSGYKNDIQQKGSTQTYLQRYTLIGALGLSTADEDNDGRGTPTTNQQQHEQTEEESLGQWQQNVDAAKSRVELTNMYLKNRKTIDANPKVQAIFKARQEQLPVVTQKTELP